MSDQELLATTNETAKMLAEKPAGALRAIKQLLKRPSREQMDQTVKAEDEEFTTRVRSAEAKEAFTACIEKRRPDFAKAREAAGAR